MFDRQTMGAVRWPLVVVRWLDSCDVPGWTRLSTWQGVRTLECVSVGFLVHEDEISKTLAPHLAYPNEEHTTQGSGIMVIPAGAILEVREIPVGVSATSAANRLDAGRGHSAGRRESAPPSAARPQALPSAGSAKSGRRF